MSTKLITAAFALGVFVLVIAFMFPSMAAAPDTNVNETVALESGDTERLGNGINVTADSVGSSSANVTVTDTETQASNETSLASGETDSIELSGETLSVTVDSVEDSTTAVVTVSYPSTFGWEDGAVSIAENFHLFIALIGFLLIMGSIIGVFV